MAHDAALVRRTISLTPELAARVDDWQFRNRIKKEVEAVRRLLEIALEAEEQKIGDPSQTAKTK
jgi:hypothetical protein